MVPRTTAGFPGRGRAAVAARAAAGLLQASVRRPPRGRAPVRTPRPCVAAVAASDVRALAPAIPRPLARTSAGSPRQFHSLDPVAFPQKDKLTYRLLRVHRASACASSSGTFACSLSAGAARSTVSDCLSADQLRRRWNRAPDGGADSSARPRSTSKSTSRASIAAARSSRSSPTTSPRSRRSRSTGSAVAATVTAMAGVCPVVPTDQRAHRAHVRALREHLRPARRRRSPVWTSASAIAGSS